MDETMQIVVRSQLAYLAITAIATLLVGRALFKNGLVFLVDAFGGDEQLAHSVNHLLVVGFYLVNAGAVGLLLGGGRPATPADAIETVGARVGSVLLALGVLHFGNLLLFTLLRQTRIRRGIPAPVKFQKPETRVA